ncbi:MAG: ABC transporter ATP-binding protein [Clostridia bacterium]|nr:ABC transporter ATP-binding protein [Clostridia bacterium]
MIRFENVSVQYEKSEPVLRDLSFHIQKGEKVGLIGANGAGKTTLMNALLGLLPHEGTITVEGIEVVKQNLPEIRKRLGFVFQNSDNQMFMPTVYEDMSFAPLNYGHSKEEVDRMIDGVLEQLELSDLKYRHNHRISGGEKRMAAIATILVMRPHVILMDEPTASLDPYNRRKVIDVMRSFDRTMLVTSHDLDMIVDTCQRVILLSRGKIVADGKTDEILHDKALLEANRMELPFRWSGNRE